MPAGTRESSIVVISSVSCAVSFVMSSSIDQPGPLPETIRLDQKGETTEVVAASTISDKEPNMIRL